MRISEQLRLQSMLTGITARSDNLSRVYERLATQRAVTRPSDDLVKTGTIMRMSSHLKRLEQSRESIQTAQTFTDTATSYLTDCNDQVQSIVSLAVRAANGAFSSSELETIANEIDQQLETLVQYGNGTCESRYLFSGTRTDTASIQVTRDADGKITSLAYGGGDSQLQFPIDGTRTFAGAPTAQTVFFDTGMMDAVLQLRDDLRNSETFTSEELAARLTADLGAVNDAKTLFNNETGRLASRAAELDMLATQTESAITRSQEIVSEARDVDMAELAVEMQREQTVYQALLAANAKIMDVNLLNYL